MKVSVCMITYNHEKYIAQAIESVLMQETDFEYELVIGEDCSTDKTREVVVEYEKKYPDKIRLLLPERNLGMMKNFITTLQACCGEYVALLEGDDYWTDKLKLQKQINYLDINSQYVLCFHNVLIVDQKGNIGLKINENDIDKEYTFKDILPYNPTATASLVIRSKTLSNLPLWLNQSPFGDWALLFILIEQGRAYCIGETMAVYRKHETSVYASKNNSLDGKIEIAKAHLCFDKIIRKYVLKNAFSEPFEQQHLRYHLYLLSLYKKKRNLIEYVTLNSALFFAKYRPEVSEILKNYLVFFRKKGVEYKEWFP